MIGHPMNIQMEEDTIPFAIHMPRLIPFASQDQVKKELMSMVKQGIIIPK